MKIRYQVVPRSYVKPGQFIHMDQRYELSDYCGLAAALALGLIDRKEVDFYPTEDYDYAPRQSMCILATEEK